ncbi:PREDICTED: GATA zinc finger domain-containing protein 1 [Drosophila arizonae]|uniref:GATA zinc finger domain-containing protein 1 n=1 Tax=Drosophila arizonae TaxID=7263 RepID=A0ABM1PUR8_DROAR|nr:PREDICTED: GATA zinc finger domain-containing protein 1 [Drosophila arizonae]
MATALDCEALINKCQKESVQTGAGSKLSQRENFTVVEIGAKGTDPIVKMETDADLTTAEILNDLDEVEQKAGNGKGSKAKPKDQQLQPNKPEQPGKGEQKTFQAEQPTLGSETQPINTETKLEEEAAAVAASATATVEMETEGDLNLSSSKMATTCHAPARPTKVTRSSLNGARSPTIIKRLRKSTRSTRFKAKLQGRNSNPNGGAAGASSHHNGQLNGGGAGAGAGSGYALNAGGAGKTHGKAGLGGVAGGSAGGASGGGARNRRSLFKRPAQKTPRVQASMQYVKSVFYKGSYMQIGDIVSIVDSQRSVYYAQIRGLLVDAYCEKSAFLTWLIPTQDSPDPQEGFDPATYLIGPDEELSRKLCYLEFVMHAPSNYYYDCTTPFPLPDVDDYQRSGGYIWTRLPTVKREREREKERIKDRDRDMERKSAA